MIKNRITKLDGLRGIFSIAVVLYHYPIEYLPDYLGDLFLIRESYIFVDFFFVLSGFVIALNYYDIKRKNQFFIYLKKRFSRLYPLLFSTTLIFWLVAVLYYAFSKLILNTGHDVAPFSLKLHLINPTIKFLETVLFLNSMPLIRTTGGFGMNGPSWSISAEMVSYIIFGIISISFASSARSSVLKWIVAVSCYILYLNGDFFSTGDYGFLRGVIGFSFGYFVWEFYAEKRILVSNWLEYLVPVILIFLMYILHVLPKDNSISLIYGMVVIPLFFSLVIIVFLNSHGFVSQLLETRVFQFFGKISYSLYLNHSLFVTILLPAFVKYSDSDLSMTGEHLVLILSLVVMILYSKFTYDFIEKKLGRKFKAFVLGTARESDQSLG